MSSTYVRTHEPGEDDYQDSVTLNILEEETMTLDTHFPWRNRKLLAFYNRNQGESEHEGKYLEAIKNLAFEAGFKEDSKMFKSYIVNRFLDGVHDAALKSKILAQNSNPSLEDLDSICNTNGFDLLLSRNVEHIWERIFLSLDYHSFKRCHSVCRAWNDAFTKDSFAAKAKSAFGADMWFDTQRLERKVWKSNKYVYAWTTDGKEVAYMESNDEEDDSEILHFIDIEGNLISRGLKLKRVSVEILWILRHVN